MEMIIVKEKNFFYVGNSYKGTQLYNGEIEAFYKDVIFVYK